MLPMQRTGVNTEQWSTLPEQGGAPPGTQTDSGNDSGRVDFKNVTRVCLPSYTGLV